MSVIGKNLMEPEPTLLPAEPEVVESLAAGEEPVDLAAKHPTCSLVWALLAEEALDAGYTVEGYAYARVGYHRGLDALRANGWRGQGPVPWSHEPNRGFLRALAALGQAAAAIGEINEVDRIGKLLNDSDPTAAEQIRSLRG
ncbi:DUF3151 domain-containing protein [Nesterenkonia alkaliphila]|uniref:DUF3151 family protein n=1 Tax=Nesterenkonia alkaliphila TaxID=1463631 RepID=A0A7K1UIM8_9MICC|nr:DUF3151 domain-containing protein [Nesterenkonia alkaliphila]MVT26328.1 DUF3151 family protein [Nesterenkonia alkaliphila]GFZ88404.1 hypothetical protein GCM10011359_17120 [Nesterenkonia alkaliphila]